MVDFVWYVSPRALFLYGKLRADCANGMPVYDSTRISGTISYDSLSSAIAFIPVGGSDGDMATD